MQVGHLYYDPAADTFCEPIEDSDILGSNEVEALEEDYEMEDRTGKLSTPFMIAERGGCSFVTKVRNMEDVGVAVGIVIDETEGEDIADIVMADDGTGAGIRIPSMLISK